MEGRDVSVPSNQSMQESFVEFRGSLACSADAALLLHSVF